MATTTKGRVLIPKNPKDLFELAGKIYQKHQADGATSAVGALDGEDWNAVGPTLAQGLVHHTEAERLKGLMEAEYRKRDAVLVPADQIVRASSVYLKAKFAKTPKRLAEWGFAVDDTPRAKAAKPAKPNALGARPGARPPSQPARLAGCASARPVLLALAGAPRFPRRARGIAVRLVYKIPQFDPPNPTTQPPGA